MDNLTGLQTARIFHDLGAPVFGMAQDVQSPYCATRTVLDVRPLPGMNDPLAATLAALPIFPDRPGVIVPCTDELVRKLSRERSALPAHFRFILPEDSVLERLTDKTQNVSCAQEAGIPVPVTRVISTPADAEAAAAEMRFPCILKPARRTQEWLDRMRKKVFRVPNRDALIQLTSAWLPNTEPLVLQEWIEGGDSDMFTVYAYLDRNIVPLVSLVGRMIRQWPVETGVASLLTIVDAPDVLNDGLRLLRSTGFRGLANVQSKRDRRDGRVYFVEVNAGRPALGMPIAEACGMELFRTFYCDALGLPPPSRRSHAQVGAKWICWKTDLASAWTYWRRKELSLGEWWRSVQGIRRCALFSLTDPAPLFFDLLRKVRRSGG